MKKFFFVKAVLISFLMVFLILTPIVMAEQVGLVGGPNGYGPYQTGSGGEFTFQVLDSNLNWILNSYVSGKTSDLVGAPYLSNFQTFCVETGEYISSWGTYDVRLSDHSIFSNKNLTVGAAWLYENFQSGGNFGGYATYDYTNAGRSGSADQLQEAIWWLMGVANDPGNTNIFRDAVISEFTTAGAFTDNNGQFPVMVLSLWDPGYVGTPGHQHQDQLVCDAAPVPEPTTMLLLGSGLLSLVGLRRKFKK